MRRRTATYVLLIVPIVLTALVYLADRSRDGRLCLPASTWATARRSVLRRRVPAGVRADRASSRSAFGGLLAIVYAAAIVGADWNWGVLRNIIARGESRARYLLAKAVALAIVLGIGVLIVFCFAFLMTFVAACIYGIPVANPFRGDGLAGSRWPTSPSGYPVVLERAALGFAVAVVLRSQLAGAVVGVVLFVGEGVLTTFLTIASV